LSSRKIPIDSNSSEKSFKGNIDAFSKNLEAVSDHLPYLEPWFGTGVYANAFGCEYVWREGEAPATHYKYHSIYDVKDIRMPLVKNSEIMQLVLNTISYFKEKTSGMLPIALTDTQSSFDTATLVLDASEVFIACYTEPEIIKHFMTCINDLIIEFSKMQQDLIGKNVAKPGHIMVSDPTLSGISISDDNLAVSSPNINEIFPLPLDQKLADAFGGLAIHSCGNWVETMKLVRNMKNVNVIDFALDSSCDPNPNKPEDVRDAFSGSSIVLKARFGTKEMDNILNKLFDKSLRIIVEICGTKDINEKEKAYNQVKEKLISLYNIK